MSLKSATILRTLAKNVLEKNVMKELEGGKFELVQNFNEAVSSSHGNDAVDVDENHLATDGDTLRFPSNFQNYPHRENFTIDNNRYSCITNRQPDDAVEHNVSNNGIGEVERRETETVIPITRATMIYVLCAALNSCNLGYDIGVSTNVSKLIQNDIHITDTQREIWIGFINFWASKLRLYLVFLEIVGELAFRHAN